MGEFQGIIIVLNHIYADMKYLSITVSNQKDLLH